MADACTAFLSVEKALKFHISRVIFQRICSQKISLFQHQIVFSTSPPRIFWLLWFFRYHSPFSKKAYDHSFLLDNSFREKGSIQGLYGYTYMTYTMYRERTFAKPNSYPSIFFKNMHCGMIIAWRDNYYTTISINVFSNSNRYLFVHYTK